MNTATHIAATENYLREMAAILSSRHFATWLDDTCARFDWAGSRLNTVMRTALDAQMHGAGFDRARTPAQTLARACAAMANTLQTRYALAASTSTAPATDAYDCTTALIALAGTLDAQFNTLRREGARWSLLGALHDVHDYAEARLTLTQDTGNAVLEGILANLSEDYLLDGRPMDCLAGIAKAVRASNGTGHAIAMANDWCAAYWLPDDDYSELMFAGLDKWTIHLMDQAA